jgi:hypothetical protein
MTIELMGYRRPREGGCQENPADKQIPLQFVC